MGNTRKRGSTKDKPGKKGKKKKQSKSQPVAEVDINEPFSGDDLGQLSSDQETPNSTPKRASVKTRKSRRDLNGPETEEIIAENKKLLKAKIQAPPKTEKGFGSTLLALFFIWLVLISGGVYVYFFVDVDVTDVIDTIQTRVAEVIGQVNEKFVDPVKEASPPADVNPIIEEPPVPPKPPAATEAPTPVPTEAPKEEASKVDQNKEDESKEEKRKRREAEKKSYEKIDITNNADYKIRKRLDEADKLVEDKKPKEAILKYETILQKHPESPRATYGVAWATDTQSELEQSNTLLERCVEKYLKVLDLSDVPKALLLKAGRRCADRQQFRGWGFRAMNTLKRLLELHPDDVTLWNELGVKALLGGKNEEARTAFKEALLRDPEDGYALVHMGFIVKQVDGDYKGSIPYLEKGISSDAKGVHDGRFYFHLGDALYRTGSHEEAYKIYEQGAEKGLFYSKWQRSLYNADGLTGRPWWTKAQTKQEKMLKLLEDNWETIRDEGMAQLDEKGLFVPEQEDLRETGDWKQFTLYQRGRKVAKNCDKAPKTCALLDKFEEATSCKRGQIKFSVMHPGVHVWPHCGPTNCRIRAHLGLVIPDGVKLRVTDEIRTWKEGKFIIFDDSFEHEVWHEGNSTRLVLIVDIWHPDLTARQKASLSPI